MHLDHIILLWTLFQLLVSGALASSRHEGAFAPPTVSPLFAQGELPHIPRPLPVATAPSTRRTPVSAPEAAFSAEHDEPKRERYVSMTIYGDHVHSDWSAEASRGVHYDLLCYSPVYSGSAAIEVTPVEDYGTLFLAVREDAQRIYAIDDVAGISLWLNSGAEPLPPDELAVTLVGSNAYPYWVADDTSVETDEERFFSESRLYNLGIIRPVPPETWVEVIVWRANLPYEPEYTYLTGIYIKNDEGFRRTFYVDEIVLWMVE